jgi:hypothetical protein
MKKIALIIALLPMITIAQFVNRNEANGLIQNTVKCFSEDVNGDLWVGTNGGVSHQVAGVFHNYTITNGLINNVVVDVIVDNQNKVWIGTPTGLSVFDGYNFVNYTTSNGLVGNDVKDLVKDANGNIWIATSSGISVYNGYSFQNFTMLDGLPSNSIKKLSVDQNGVVWIGTISGLCKYNNPGFTVYTTADGLPSNYVAMFYAKDKVYIGNTNGSLYVFDGSNSTIYNSSNGLPTGVIKGITVDDNLHVWLAYANNIVDFDLTIPIFYNNTNTNLTNSFSSICINSQNLYVGTSDNGYFQRDINLNITIQKYDTLNINNINALVNSNGILFQGFLNNLFETPSGSGINSNFASSIWLGGIDDDDLFHMAGGRFHEYTDWGFGPISNDYSSVEYDTTYNRVWKINKSDIDYHILHWSDVGYIVPGSISLWPNIADYVDFNNDGIYNPENGDYPQIMGDQAILCIFNDVINEATQNRNKMNVQVHALVYAYNAPSDSALNNTIFTQYKIYNKSDNNYRNVYLGVYDDIDIGDAFDDYVGVDTLSSSFYIYNGDNSDLDFGTVTPSASSVTFLSSKMTSSTYYTNDINNSIMADPETSIDYYNTMRGLWRDGSPYTEGGNGYGGTTPVKYVFPGYPLTPTSWNEAYVSNVPGDRRGVGIVGPFAIDTGANLCIDVAYINAIDYNGTNITSVKELLNRAQYIHWWKNHNPGLSCDSIITTEETNVGIFLLAQDVSACENEEEVVLSFIRFGGEFPFTYHWEDSLGNYIGPNPIHTIPTPTTTTKYYITVTDANGVTATDSLVVTILPTPDLVLQEPNWQCAGDVIVMDVLGYYEYLWNNGSTSHIAIFDEGPVAVLTVTDENGCSTTSGVPLTFVNQTTDLSPVTPSCFGAATVLDAGSNFVSYNWNTGDTTQTITVLNANEGDIYTVEVLSYDGCVFTGQTVLHLDTPTVTLGNDTSIYYGNYITYYPGSYAMYNWSNFQSTQQYTFNGSVPPGNYSVWVKVLDSYGCQANDTVIITVIDTTTYVENKIIENITVYPNPAKDIIQIENLTNDIIKEIEVINEAGVKLKIFKINTKTKAFINIEDLPAAAYYLNIKYNSKNKLIKIIKN